MWSTQRAALRALFCAVLLVLPGAASAELKTWDGKHSIDEIEVQAVYFVPRDRTPLPDWKDRVGYFCRRVEAFHRRELAGQSKLTVKIHPEPFRSGRSVEQLRSGDGDFIFDRTLAEVDAALGVGAKPQAAFPVLLVFGDVNWRPLDDFYRLKPTADGLEFEGTYTAGEHFPGSPAGGARAAYLGDPGKGWALVSADGWRVPYRGSDCVVYHEGLGHTVGLPHPEPGDDSVMSFGQYRGWLSESHLNRDQRQKLGFQDPNGEAKRDDLFSKFTARAAPAVPRPDEEVALQLNWPADARLRSARVRIQTDLFGPWLEIARLSEGPAPPSVKLGRFDRPTPVSYRVDATLDNGEEVELWGYFQVREAPENPPLPTDRSIDLRPAAVAEEREGDEVDLLALVDLQRDGVAGDWQMAEGKLIAPKLYGARIELPYVPPDEYRLTVVAEPLDEPHGLILGQRAGGRRFQVLVNFADGGVPLSALEDVDGKNVGANATTVSRALFKKNRPSQIVCTVREDSVMVAVDGRQIIDWRGKPAQLSLPEYWKTPHDDALFLGAYDCRYRISRATLTPLSGTGRPLRP